MLMAKSWKSYPNLTGDFMKQRLFKRNGEKIGWWEVETIGSTLIKRWATTLKGKVQERSKSFEGKGKQGRSDSEQADFMARSEITTQIDGGYVYELDHAVNWPVTNSLGFPMPMLATAYKKVTVDYGHCSLTPKLDGHRMMFGMEPCQHKVADSRYKASKGPALYSRGSQRIDLPFILDEAQRLCRKIGVQGLDGELYHHGTALQDIKTMVAEKDRRLKWHLYDAIDQGDHRYRRDLILEGFTGKVAHLTVVPSHDIDSQEAMQHLHQKYTKLGYEGTILRWGRQPYMDDARPSTLVKVKDFVDEEFEVVDMVFDEPRHDQAGAKLLCPSFIVKNNNGTSTTFKVTVHGGMYEKSAVGAQGIKHWIGRTVTISFQQRSNDGIPTICTCLGERDDL
jgi:ATP-dependent DNA ligase